MMQLHHALAYANKEFPDGPEKLAALLGIEIRYSSLNGCDGWCLSTQEKTVIRINNNLPRSRQRFTLAHELGHLLLGIPPVVGESSSDIFHSDNEEERRVNKVAADLLLPTERIKQYIHELPVSALTIRKMGKQARISVQVASIRIVNLALDLGLQGAAIVFFENGYPKWQWTNKLNLNDSSVLRLLHDAKNTSSMSVDQRLSKKRDSDLVFELLTPNPEFTALFVQLVLPEHTEELHRIQQRRELESSLFSDDKSLKQRLHACINALKLQGHDMNPDQAEEAFWSRNSEKFQTEQQLRSTKGKEYIRLLLEKFCSKKGPEGE